jgi:hypothetical protein
LKKTLQLDNVGFIVQATWGYSSMTSTPTDITEKVQRYFNATAKSNGGRLCLDVITLEDMRNRNDPLASAVDSSRRQIVQGMTLGIAGNRKLHLRYHCVQQSQLPDPSQYMHKVNRLRTALRTSGSIRDIHAEDGEYTWYKLNEWMQVEVLQIFGQSLEHTPWFRFDFMGFLRIYFDVLRKESDIVREKFGAIKAYSSMAFLTDAIPGVVMTGLFAQLQLLAMPLLQAQPAAGYDGFDQSRLMEDIVIQAYTGFDWGAVSEEIKAEVIVPGLYLLHVPTFKPLTKVLIDIAAVPSAVIFDISGQQEVQVRVVVKQRNQIDALQLKGVDIKLDYKYPTDGSQDEPGTNVALCVQVPYLLPLIRECRRIGACVAQIYDFWCG